MLTDSILLLTGIVVGLMNAVAGGGMLIGFPILVALGTPALVANAVGNVVTCPGQLASAIGYRRYLKHVPLSYAWLLIPITIGSTAGALLLRSTQTHEFDRIVPGLLLFGVLLFAFQPLLHFHLHKHLSIRSRKVLPLILLGLALIPLSIYGGFLVQAMGLSCSASLDLPA